ncbi:MAG: hypothetical protein HZC36_02085 [Armatimonadetes bacterium]|nr:hypothetical protein [Armatimonadota bacterium]
MSWLVVLGVLAAIIAGLWVVGSPSQARMEKADERRVEDLQQLVQVARGYFVNHHTLPRDQAKLYAEASSGYGGQMADPVTGKQYGYRVKDSATFELSAEFETDRSKDERPRYYGYSGDLPFWRHKKGLQWFAVKAKAPPGGY